MFDYPLVDTANGVFTIRPRFARGSYTTTFTRATTKTGKDFEGKIFTALSGEVVCEGARRVYNQIASGSASQTSDNFTGYSDYGTPTSVTFSTSVAPQGATGSTVITNNAIFQGKRVSINGTISGKTITFSVTAKGAVGGELLMFTDDAGTGGSVTLTTEFVRYSKTITATSNTQAIIVAQAAVATVYVAKASVENVTGQSNQNPSEYVSVGVLSAPYHGVNVDGVKVFTYENGNTVASNVVTEAQGAAINSSNSKFGVLPGVSGSYFSTPDSADVSITGDIDIRVQMMAPDWTPASVYTICGKDPTGATTAYRFDLAAAGTLVFVTTADGSTVRIATSSVATGFTDGTRHWVRVTRASASGDAIFYTSEDGSTWTQLGTTVSTTAGAIYDNTGAVEVGGARVGTAQMMTGRIYRAQIYNGIAGTLAVDFNPNLSTSAQTLTAATGEVWTSNGNARIFGNTNTTYGIPAPWDEDGPAGYNAEPAATNLCLQSGLASGWVATNMTLTANQYVAPNGTTTMAKILATAGSAIHLVQSPLITHTAVAETQSFYVRYVNHRWVCFEHFDATTESFASFDLLNGAVGAVSAGVTSTIEPTAEAGVYRITMTKTSAAGDGSMYLMLNNSDTASRETWNAAGTEIVGAWGAQLETGSVATSYIPTTTVAVTRNTDVLTVPSAGNVLGTTGTVYAEVATSYSGAAFLPAGTDNCVIGFNAGAGSALPLVFANNLFYLYDGASRTLENNVAPSTTVRKIASSWGGSSSNGAISGVLGNTSPASFDGDLNIGDTIVVGAETTGTTGHWVGTIRNLRIYNRALSAAELQALTA